MNPATLVANFNGDLAAEDQSGATSFTENGKLRYRPAKDARINLLQNTRAITDLTSWGIETTATITRVTGLSFPELPAGVTTGVKVACTGGNNSEGVNLTGPLLPYFPSELKPTHLRGSGYFWADAPCTLDIFGWRAVNRADGVNPAAGTGAVVCNITTTPQKFTTNAVPLAAYENPSYLQLVGRFNAAHAAVNIYTTCWLAEYKDTLGDWFDGEYTSEAAYLELRNGRIYAVPGYASVSQVAAMPEPEVRNLVPNPYFSTDATGWSAANGSIARDTVRIVYALGHGLLTASGANATASISITAASGEDHRALWLITNRATTSRTFQLRYNGSVIGDPVAVIGRGDLIISAPFVGTGSSAALEVQVTDSVASDTFAIDYAGAYPGLDTPSLCPDIVGGVIQTGCTWDGTAHNSPSTRADSRPTITPTSHADPTTGSVVYRWRKDQATGNARVLLSVGEVGVGKDRMELRETADGHLQMAWQSNNLGETVITDTSVTFSRYGWYDLYAEWSGTAVGIAVNDGSRVTGVRNAPSGSFGSGLIRLGG